ncbi:MULTISPECIES: SDR family oxidoreductase [Micrococcaceae]|uniref:SDR family NAD(P)-dependent oxidoreductase n=1 Tax=Micrococcaceae TaxID=1268 RepID=UPI0003194DA9|nr:MULTISPECIES: SDR family oxidoreductase [Micrococcaceae]MBP2269140.1 NAD(P)-dependent dehydrogenase (short-subunit alcohol dehydrogenase family) [Pseudarthrobacter sp. PvP004]
MNSKTILVTGAANGIGEAVSRQVVAAGGAVVLVDRDADAIAAIAADLSSGRRQVRPMTCDVSNETEVKEVFRRLHEEGVHIDGLVTAAGIDIGGAAHELSVEDWRRVMDINLTGSYLFCRELLGRLVQEQRPGSIVLCSSPAASVGFAAGGATAYSASKGGISAMVRSLAVDYAQYGIRVNAIVPGPTETNLMWAAVPEDQRAAMRNQIAQEVPLGRMASPDEPARAALWLLGSDSSYVTGSHLVCDGGVLAKASISV